MLESDVMAAAVHAARSSPPRFQTLHPPLAPPPPPPPSSLAMTHPLAFPSLEKQRQFLPGLHFPGSQPPHSFPFHMPPPPLPPPPSSAAAHLPPPTAMSQMDEDEDVFEEDVDEDDMSDLDEELQQELIAYRNRQRQPDMTRQLLAFADMVNGDIQKFFGRKKGDEESCDVYEDKWTATKSGRELYYADLLRMAQGDFGDSKSSKKARNNKEEALEDNRHSFSGKADSAKGLGGLKDLFDQQGMKPGANKQKNASSSSSSSHHHHSAAKRSRTTTDTNVNTTDSAVPMHQRRFPDSFWREPGTLSLPGSSSGAVCSSVGGDHHPPVAATTSSVLQSLAASSKLPDFSDLMESWHGGEHQLPHHQLHPLHQIQLHHHHHRMAASAAAVGGGAGSETFAASSDSDSAARKRRL